MVEEVSVAGPGVDSAFLTGGLLEHAPLFAGVMADTFTTGVIGAVSLARIQRGV